MLLILGILSSAAVATFSPETFWDVGAHADARRIALHLRDARRRAIATGDNHLLEMHVVDSAIVGYQMIRRASGGDVAVDQPYSFPSQMTVVVSPGDPEFTFEGSPVAGGTLDLAGANRSYRITVHAATGAVEVVETTP